MDPSSKLAVKMVAEDGATFTVGGYGLVWGGQDVEGERFTKDTDFWFDRLTETPMVLYRHGREKAMLRTVVGSVIKKLPDDVGLWIEAQIKDHEDYSAAIRGLVGKGVLGWSSGAVPHLVDKVKKGGVTEITSWPIAEWSLVPDPAEPRTIGVAEIKGFDPALAETIASLKTVKDLPEGATLMADDDGGQYPEGSYEDLATDIARLMRKSTGGYCYVTATFPGYALVCCDDTDEGMQYLRVAYDLDAEGEPVLGSMERVTPAMVPLPMPQTDEAPLAIQSARLTEYAELVLTRTKDVSARRIKEGRVLSESNRERLTNSAAAIEGALKTMRGLLDATEPQSAKAASVDAASVAARARARDLEALHLYAISLDPAVA